MFSNRWSVPVVLGVLASSLAGLATPASGFSGTQPNIVNAVPATNTPDVNNGAVFAITQVAGTMYVGGSFTSISTHGSSTAMPVKSIAAFDPSTGALKTTFAPNLNGNVQTLAPGPAANEIYVGGAFTTANGVTTHVALLDATTGATISTWQPSAQNGIVQELAYVPNVDNTGTAMLFAGGSFTTVGGTAHGGLVALNPTTGKVLSYVGLSFTGHHNYGVNCTGTNCANGPVGLRDLDVDPSGTHLVAIGNFTSVAGSSRDQLALIDLGTNSATVDANFQTQAYTAACFASAFDTYMRGVSFSPDGSFFAVVATGGSGTNKDGTNSSCDTAARFETNGSGSNIRPTWLDYTGQDTLLSVAITGGVVYVGGHERWMNNSRGHDNPGAGAIPRPGLAALSAVSGVPFSWNPGRSPRGAGTWALYPTSSGLWIGSDTDYIGPTKYLHKKLAFFPLQGGEAFPNESIPTLPGRVYTAGALSGSNLDRFTYRHFDGTTAGLEQSQSTGVAWSGIRGAFMVNGELIYSKPDGNLYERSFDGTTLGSEVQLDPYDDPVWDNVDTGSGQTYQGQRSNISTETTSITSLFFTNGRLYYTLSGQSAMHWRWFEPESGTVGSDEFTVSDGKVWSNIAGAFLSGNTLYYADKTTGALLSVGWTGTQATGTATPVNATQNWAARGLFLLADPTVPNQPPVANFTATCSTASTSCTFDATASHDPDGSISDFAWTFGQSPVEHHPDSSVFTHDFGQPGHYNVTLTVTDNDGATGTASQIVNVGQSTAVPTFRNASTACGPTGGTGSCATTVTETDAPVPSGTAAGDALLLFVTWPSATTNTASVPSGWQLVGTDTSSPLESDVYYRPATSTDVGTTVPVTFSGATRNSVILADYTGADTSAVEAFAKSADSNTSSHTTPNATVTQDGSLAVSYWADKGSNTAWALPGSVTGRATQFGAGQAGYPTAALADSGSDVASGTYGSKTATTNATSGKGTEWTIILAPAAG